MLLKKEQFKIWLEHKQLGTPDEKIAPLLNIKASEVLLLNNIYKFHGLEICKTIINSTTYPELSDQYILNVACRILKDNLSNTLSAAIFLCSRNRCYAALKRLRSFPNLLSSCTPEPYPKMLCSSLTQGKNTYHFDYDPDSQPSYHHPWLIYNKQAPENESSSEQEHKTKASVCEELSAHTPADNTNTITTENQNTAPEKSFLPEETSTPDQADNTDIDTVENKSATEQDEKTKSPAPSLAQEELDTADQSDSTNTTAPQGSNSALEQAKELDENQVLPTYPVTDCPLDELSMDDILDDMDIYDSDDEDNEPLVTFSPVAPIEDSACTIKEDHTTLKEDKEQSSSTHLSLERQENANSTPLQEAALDNESDPIARANMKAAQLMQQEIADSTKAPKDSSFDYQKLHVFGIDALALNALLTNNIRQANPIALKELPQRFVILGGAKHNVLRAKNLGPYHVVALFNRDDPHFAQLCESQEQRTQQQLHPKQQ